MEKISIKPVTAGQAAQVLADAGIVDPAGLDTPASIAAAGHAFELVTPDGAGVFVASKNGATLWIHGAGSTGSHGIIRDGMALCESMAMQVGCSRVAFQTARPGLVKIAKKRGYRVAGFILEKT